MIPSMSISRTAICRSKSSTTVATVASILWTSEEQVPVATCRAKFSEMGCSNPAPVESPSRASNRSMSMARVSSTGPLRSPLHRQKAGTIRFLSIALRRVRIGYREPAAGSLLNRSRSATMPTLWSTRRPTTSPILTPTASFSLLRWLRPD